MFFTNGVMRAYKTIFEILKLVNTTFCPSIVRFRNHQSFNSLCTLKTVLRKLRSSFILFLYEKKANESLIASLSID